MLNQLKWQKTQKMQLCESQTLAPLLHHFQIPYIHNFWYKERPYPNLLSNCFQNFSLILSAPGSPKIIICTPHIKMCQWTDTQIQ